jgi:uncharacterized protein
MPNIVYSELGGHFTQDGVSVEVVIVNLDGGSECTLEVVNSKGTSIVWDDTFLDDHEAYAEFQRTVTDEGIEALVNIVYSELGGQFTQDGVSVEVVILKLEGSSEWTLEVVNSNGTSIVWDDTFLDDHEAYAEFQQTVTDEGMEAFLDQSNSIQFPGR